MIAKYEKKMYYSDPVSKKVKNDIEANPTVTTPFVATDFQVNIKYTCILFLFLE